MSTPTGPPPGGWVKLYRSLRTHGHFQMSDTAFKVWMFLLVAVNHRPAAGCAAGEGWITYAMIRDECCDPRKTRWADSTISRALAYLDRGKYIVRIKTKKGAAQRIRIVNWHKFQEESSSDTQVPALEVALEVPLEPPLEVALEPPLEKQEGREREEGKKNTSSAAARAEPQRPRKSSSTTEKAPDPYNQMAQPLVRKIDTWLKEQGAPGVPGDEWGKIVSITAKALKGGAAGAPIPAEEAEQALTWAMADRYWRGELLAYGTSILRKVWGKWKSGDRGPTRKGNQYVDPAADGPKFLPDSPWNKRSG